MTLVIRSWAKWQKAGLGAVKRSRSKRRICLMTPYSMSQLVVAVVSDEGFMDFTRRSRRRDADALWLRVLRYAALHGALTGEVRVPRESFGRVVLSTAWDTLSKRTGEGVYSALIDSGLCSELVPNEIGTGSRCSCSSCCSSSTPLPPEQGEPPADAAPAESTNGATILELDTPSIVRPRDRQRLERIAEFVIHCGAGAKERASGLDLRTRLRAGITDAEVAIEIGKHTWVTKQRLANFERGNSR